MSLKKARKKSLQHKAAFHSSEGAGIDQLAWNKDISRHGKILEAIGATPEQTKALQGRDWLALPRWAREKIKGLKPDVKTSLGLAA